MRMLLAIFLAAIALIFASTLDYVDKDIPLQEYKGWLTILGLVAFVLLAIIITAQKKTTAHV